MTHNAPEVIITIMPLGLLGKKLGMSQIFDAAGTLVPVTMIQAGPCPILMKREIEREGYAAIQLGFDPKPDRLVLKPEKGLFAKLAELIKPEDRDRILATRLPRKADANDTATLLEEIRKRHAIGALRFIREIRLDAATSVEVGQVLDVSLFKEGDRIDIIGSSKGRGFAGVVKRHHSKPGPDGHGSMYHRRPGSMGGSSAPSRVFKLKPLAGRMGNTQVTAQNLKVVKIDPEKNLLFVRGSVPGAPNGYVLIRPTVKGRRSPAKTILA